MKKYIEMGWEGYRRMVVPPDASEVQVAETKQAFFAGAAILFQALMMALDPGLEETDRDLQRMAAIQEEIDAFGQSLDKKILKPAEH